MNTSYYSYVFHPEDNLTPNSVWRIYNPDLPLGDYTFDGWIPEHIIRAIRDHLNGWTCKICREEEDTSAAMHIQSGCDFYKDDPIDSDPQESPSSEIGGRPADLYEKYLGPSYRSGHYADE